MAQTIEIPYSPRTLQRELHAAWSGHRYSVVVCHRRAGKTVAVLNHLLRDALTTKKPNARYHYLAPTYRMASNIATDYLLQFSEKIPGLRSVESTVTASASMNVD